MSDEELVAELRGFEEMGFEWPRFAADAIERLLGENERLADELSSWQQAAVTNTVPGRFPLYWDSDEA